jgi:hypothetical protein
MGRKGLNPLRSVALGRLGHLSSNGKFTRPSKKRKVGVGQPPEGNAQNETPSRTAPPMSKLRTNESLISARVQVRNS